MPKKDQTAQPTDVSVSSDDRLAVLEAQIAGLQKQLADKEEIAKRAQSDYIRLKMDMDSYVSRTESAQKEIKIEGLITIAKKLLPSVYQLKLMTDSCPSELTGNSWADGVKLLYTKLTKELELVSIFPIESSIGMEPNLTYHSPIGNEPVSDSALQGKIVKELQQGYVYRKDGDEKVILPATVIVGS